MLREDDLLAGVVGRENIILDEDHSHFSPLEDGDGVAVKYPEEELDGDEE